MDYAILTPQRTEYGRSIRKMYESGHVRERWNNMRVMVPRTDGMSNTLTTVAKDNLLQIVDGDSVRIRTLTPLECWKLQGFSEEAFRRAETVTGKTDLLKQAGNTITVTVLESIFRRAFLDRCWMKKNSLSDWGL